MSRPWASGREDDAAHALLLELVEQAALDPAVEHGVRRLVDQQRGAELARDRRGLPGLLGGVRRDAGVERRDPTAPRCRARPSSPRAGCPGRTGGCRRCRRTSRPIRARDWSSDDEDVLPRATALAVGAGPHVVAGLGRDHQLVAVGREVLPQPASEVLLRATVGRAVVVGQVDVRHASVEGTAQDRALGLLRPVVAEVLPQAQATAAAAAVRCVRCGGRWRRRSGPRLPGSSWPHPAHATGSTTPSGRSVRR